MKANYLAATSEPKALAFLSNQCFIMLVSILLITGTAVNATGRKIAHKNKTAFSHPVKKLVITTPTSYYGGPQTYTAGAPITPLTPSSSGVAVSAYSGSPVIVGSGFSYPYGVAVDAAGNVYVADNQNNAIKKVPAGGGATVTVGAAVTSPTGIAVDASGNIYVAAVSNSVILKIPAAGGAAISIGSGFNSPAGVAVDAAEQCIRCRQT